MMLQGLNNVNTVFVFMSYIFASSRWHTWSLKVNTYSTKNVIRAYFSFSQEMSLNCLNV